MTILSPSMLSYFAMCLAISAVVHYLIKRYILAVLVAFLASWVGLLMVASVLYEQHEVFAGLSLIYSGMFSLMFALPVVLIVGIPFFLRRHRRRKLRFPSGHCQTCGYDLTGNVSGICPECGKAIVEEDGADC